MNKKRVVVTGMGIVSCLGNEVESFYDSLLAGISGVRTITSFPCDDYATRFAGWIEEFNSEPYLTSSTSRPFYYICCCSCKESNSYVSLGSRDSSCESSSLRSDHWIWDGGASDP